MNRLKGYSDVLQALLVELPVLLVHLVDYQLIEGWNIAIHTVIIYRTYRLNDNGSLFFDDLGVE